MANAAAWGGAIPCNEAEARERILDAAARCIERLGPRKTSLERVAGEAGVTRPTLYAYFDGRDDLIAQTIIRAADGFGARITAAIVDLDDPRDMLVEALVFIIREIQQDPLLSQVVDVSSPDAFVLRTWVSAASVGAAKRYVLPLAERLPDHDEEDFEEIVQVMLRMILSFLASPHPEPGDEALRALLYRRVVPMLGLSETIKRTRRTNVRRGVTRR